MTLSSNNALLGTCVGSRASSLCSWDRVGTGQNYGYPVTEGKRYWILGSAVFGPNSVFLVAGDDQLPLWLPMGLFDVPEQEMPAKWLFKAFLPPVMREPDNIDMYLAQRGWVSIAGYSELVTDESHRDGVTELNEDDISVFNDQLMRLPLLAAVQT